VLVDFGAKTAGSGEVGVVGVVGEHSEGGSGSSGNGNAEIKQLVTVGEHGAVVRKVGVRGEFGATIAGTGWDGTDAGTGMGVIGGVGPGNLFSVLYASFSVPCCHGRRMFIIPPLASFNRVTISIASRLVIASELLALSKAPIYISSLFSRLLRISPCKACRASQRLMPSSTTEARELSQLVLERVPNCSYGLAMGGSSGIDSASERSEITEKASTSNGVDRRLGLGDEKVDKGLDMKGLGAVATFI